MARRHTNTTGTELTFSQDQVPAHIDPTKARGQEGVTIDDVTIPRIVMLQDLSPQIKKTKPEYVEGAEAGLMYNNVTGEVYGKEITIIPVMFRKEYIIWRDRDAGGGFRGAFPDIISAKGALVELEDSGVCDIKDTAQHFVLVVKPGSTADNPILEEAVISMSVGTMSASRQLNSLAKIAGGDRFSRAYKISALEVDGRKGTYWSYKFHPLGYVAEPMYRAGEAMYEAVKAGQRDVNRDYDDSVDDHVKKEKVESAEL